ncbi:MAG TPA: AMP-binding protein [Methylomirabilota bacterium]
MITSLQALLAGHAHRDPDAPAIVAPHRRALTYRELSAHAALTVRRLRALGVARTDAVAVVMPQGPELAVAFLGVAAGAIAAPLNPTYRPSEFDFYLGDLRARALIVHAALDSPARQVAEQRGIPVVELTPVVEAGAGIFTLDGRTDASPAAAGDDVAAPDDVALMLHTSGTTARPKLVPLTHANIRASGHNIATTLGLTPPDRCLTIMPLFHIHGLIGATLASLTAGGSLACPPAFNAEHFFDWLAELRPTWYTAVPTMHQAILAQAAAHRDVIARNPLRFIRSSSAALPARVLSELERTFQAPVIEAYGMTEGAHQLASNPVPPGRRKVGSVGRAAGPEVAIMDADGQLLPAGAVGEIVVRGPSITSGYRDNAAANAAAFTDGWFRTGDQGHLDADGYLFITSRIKELINRGGEKIAPLEVESVLLEHPAVAQAAVFPMPHATLGETVAAAVVLRPGSTGSESELQRFVLERLADYKAPSRVVCLAEIPKGPTGKVQRTTMASQLAAQLRDEYVAPRSPAETQLTRVWAAVLGVERVGVRDNFFALGGDSLRASQVFARIRKAFGKSLPPAALLQAPTVEQLARLVEGQDVGRSCLVLLQSGGPRPPFFYVHGPGGDVLHARTLAQLVGRDQPFYGVQARALYGAEPPHRRIEEMAAHYVGEIRRHQPEGPYFLGGFCFGGQVAYEMARQLHMQGQPVALVAMIDSWVRRFPPSSTASTPRPDILRRSVRKARFHLDAMRRLDGAARRRYLGTRLGNARMTFTMALCRLVERAFARVGVAVPDRLQPRDLSLVHYRAGRSYLPQPYAGTVTLFVSEQSQAPTENDPRLAWGKLAAGGARVYTIPGSHDTLLDEAQMRQLARYLRESLETAQTSGDDDRGAAARHQPSMPSMS